MTTNTLTIPSTVDALIGAYRSHVLGRTLPEPSMLNITASSREIALQPCGAVELCSRLGNLLIWAYTLADVTGRWWRTTDDRLHVSVTGRTTGGARIHVYCGGPFIECQGLVSLEPDQHEGVSLDELYALVGLLREAQDQREVA